MRRVRELGAVAFGVLLILTPSPAGAGGWWSSVQVPSRYLAVGDTVTVSAEDVFPTREQHEAAFAGEPPYYYVYLLQGTDREMVDTATGKTDPGDWWTPPPVMFELAQIDFVRNAGGIFRVATEVQIPDVDPGNYEVMLCTHGCADPLAYAIPANVTIVDASAASLVKSLQDARRNVTAARDDARKARRSARTIGREFEWAQVEARAQERRIEDLEADLAIATGGSGSGETSRSPIVVAFSSGAAATFALMWAVRRARRRFPRFASSARW